MENTVNKKRRNFINYLLGGSVAAFGSMMLYPVVRFLIPPKLPEADVSSVLVGSVSDFPPNEGKLFQFGRKPGLLIRTSEGEFRAFIAICTHLDCTVKYRNDMGIIWCACHNGSYDLNGINIGGPPPRPLTQLKVNIQGDNIYVSHEA